MSKVVSGCGYGLTPYQDFHDPTSVLTLAFGYSACGNSGPTGMSGYEELRFKFQALYHLTACKNYESALY